MWTGIVFVAIGAIGGCINMSSLTTNGYLCKNDCSRTTGFCKKSICNQQLQLRTIFWIELGEFLCCNWEYIFQILCKKVKVTWLLENWGTLWIFYSYFINSWKLNKCFHYDILPLTARYIYNSNQFMNISKFPPSPNKIPRCILSKPTEHGVCYQFYDWSL